MNDRLATVVVDGKITAPKILKAKTFRVKGQLSCRSCHQRAISCQG